MSKKKNRKKRGGNWGVPKNAKAFFDPHYDDEFRAKHPILFWLTVIAIVACVMVGPTIYLYFCSLIQSNVIFFELLIWIFGFVSSFAISIGVCNLFMIVHKQYLGHYVTLGSFAIGFAGSAISLLLLWII